MRVGLRLLISGAWKNWLVRGGITPLSTVMIYRVPATVRPCIRALIVQFSESGQNRRLCNRVRIVSAAQAQDQVERAFFLDVVIGQRTVVLELFAGENEALLVGGNAFLSSAN